MFYALILYFKKKIDTKLSSKSKDQKISSNLVETELSTCETESPERQNDILSENGI